MTTDKSVTPCEKKSTFIRHMQFKKRTQFYFHDDVNSGLVLLTSDMSYLSEEGGGVTFAAISIPQSRALRSVDLY